MNAFRKRRSIAGSINSCINTLLVIFAIPLVFLKDKSFFVYGFSSSVVPELSCVAEYCETISKGVIVELYSDNQCCLGIVERVSFQIAPNEKNGKSDQQIKSSIEVKVAPKQPNLNDAWESRTVDIGQITTIWRENSSCNESSNFGKVLMNCNDIIRSLPVRKDEIALNALWTDTRSRKSKFKLTKKQINNFNSVNDKVKEILKRILKQERGLVTGRDAACYLLDNIRVSDLDASAYFAGSITLANDAKLGGRFKRSPCWFVSCNQEDESVVVLNGGWLAVDEGVKSLTEAKRFIDRSNNKSEKIVLHTEADQRIANKLECLAMGQAFKSFSSETLESDVKAVLSSMHLPFTSEGAADALIRIGRWTKQSIPDSVSEKKYKVVEPWSKEVLNATRQLVQHNRHLYAKFIKCSGTDFEGRANLISLPCICIDAKGTQFRDDAIGIRLRSSTGRKVTTSKWELLVHIVDMSDLYAPQSAKCLNFAKCLANAAQKRGFSRYDLPFGPLHLLPPAALEALSLKGAKSESVNRCVTIWAYIDEKTGKLIDFGAERTIVSPPLQLTFDSASKLLQINRNKVPNNYKNEKLVLDIFEKVVLAWDKSYLEEDEVMKARDKRLSVKELVDRESGFKPQKAFRRSRGHRVVDAALNLYSFSLKSLLKRLNVPIPMSVGAGSLAKGGRVGTAPLRRYIDGVSQCQALAALCDFGEKTLSLTECKDVSRVVSQAHNNLNAGVTKYNASRNMSKTQNRQREALRSLAGHLSSRSDWSSPIKAFITGRRSEVVIKGVGAVGISESSMKGLNKGDEIDVVVTKIEPEKGILIVRSI